MSLILTQGFELDNPTGSPHRWSHNNVFRQTDFVRTGTYCGYASSGDPFIRHTVQASEEHVTFIIGVAFYTIGGVVVDLMRFMSDTYTTEHVILRRTATGALAIDRGSTQLAISSDNALPLSAWTYIEMKATLHDSTGSIEVRLNGASTPILTFTGDTKNGGTKTVFDTVELYVSGSVFRIDDLYLLNGAGASFNDFLGEIRCYPLLPNGNGNYSQLVGSDGNSVDNYLLVDDSGTNADYVGSSTDGQKDTYAVTNVANVASVVNLYTQHWALKSDSGAKAFRPILRTGGSDHTAADYGSLSVSLLSFLTKFQINPVTGNPWTPAELNALEIGFEVRPG